MCTGPKAERGILGPLKLNGKDYDEPYNLRTLEGDNPVPIIGLGHTEWERNKGSTYVNNTDSQMRLLTLLSTYLILPQPFPHLV